jgi:hypothetical protein
MVETFLSSPFVQGIILPFLLVFALVFAVLQKSKILGEGKKQTDAIVALVIGLIVVSFANAVGIINSLMPFLAVGLVVILVFLLLWGFVFKEGSFDVPPIVRWIFGGIVVIAVVIAVLYVTGKWDFVAGIFTGNGSASDLLVNVIFIVLVIAAILAVVLGGSSSSGEKKKD